jgi:hypothetical protein
MDKGYSAERQDMLTRSVMDSGPGKVRRRFTAGSVLVQPRWLFTHRQLAVFDWWFLAHVRAGAEPFYWPYPWRKPTNPVSAAYEHQYLFLRTRFKKLNAYKQIGGAYSNYSELVSQNPNYYETFIRTVWEVTAELEVLPQ